MDANCKIQKGARCGPHGGKKKWNKQGIKQLKVEKVNHEGATTGIKHKAKRAAIRKRGTTYHYNKSIHGSHGM